jgi:hypothetical protein
MPGELSDRAAYDRELERLRGVVSFGPAYRRRLEQLRAREQAWSALTPAQREGRRRLYAEMDSEAMEGLTPEQRAILFPRPLSLEERAALDHAGRFLSGSVETIARRNRNTALYFARSARTPRVHVPPRRETAPRHGRRRRTARARAPARPSDAGDGDPAEPLTVVSLEAFRLDVARALEGRG